MITRIEKYGRGQVVWPRKPQSIAEVAPNNLAASQDLRDQSEELAGVINRNRSVRKNRITRNSIIHVALQCFLEDFALPPGRPVNSEVELLEAAKKRRRP